MENHKTIQTIVSLVYNRNNLDGEVYNYVITEYNKVKKVKNVKLEMKGA